jgi:MFS family permease
MNAPPLPLALDRTKGGWAMVGFLTLIQIVSYIDRFLPSLLAPDIKRDLHLSAFELGLILGPAFAIFYVAVGLPFGWAADRFSRRGILAFGIAVWSATTALASLAGSFLVLFGARLGVGFGEAAVAPCAISLIGDRFDRSRRARAFSLYMAGSFIGAGSAFLFGGPLVGLIEKAPPLIPGMRPWQSAFLVMGLPGLALAAVMGFLKEPPRAEVTREGAASLQAALTYILKWRRAFGALFVGSAAVVTLGALSLWNVTLFRGTWGWGVAAVGVATGLLFFTAGPLGTLLGVWLTRRWIKAGRPDAVLRALLSGLAIAAPGFILYPLAPSAPLALLALFVAFTGQAMATAAGPACLTFLAPGQIRSQATAIYFLVISLVGQLLGPPPVGLIVDGLHWPLRYAVSAEALAVSLPALALVALGLAAFRAGALDLERALDLDSGGDLAAKPATLGHASA